MISNRLSFTLGAALAFSLSVGAVRAAKASEPVKLLKPEQFVDRVVAPRGGRVLVVNFWATWCEPCREEMPALVAAAKKFRANDLAVVLISTDPIGSGPKKVPAFLAAAKVPFVCWLVKSHDPQVFIDTVDRNWDGTVPYTMIYDRKGRPTAKLSGKQTEASFAEAIRKAVSAK